MASVRDVPGTTPSPMVAIRGSEGVYMIHGPPSFQHDDVFGRDTKCTVMAFDPSGRYFAYCNSSSVFVIQIPECETLLQVDKPKTIALSFSPTGKYLATWEVYYTTPAAPGPNPNGHIWDIGTGKCVKAFVHRPHDTWHPQWTDDERICALQANSEIHFFENGDYDVVAKRLHMPKVVCRISGAGSPPHVAAHIPGSKGSPHAARIFKYGAFTGPGSILANKSFYKADRVDMLWNKKGSAVLAVATQDVDSTGSSYYGETAVHFLSINGDSSNVTVSKKGPVYSVDWNPNSAEFCVVYGFMPARATLFNLKCEPIFDFGTGPRNCVYFNPQGTIIALGGFANLRGHMQFWERKTLKVVSETQAGDATVFQWSPDGHHYATAVCAPRLRVGNGFKVWHVGGSLLHEYNVPSDNVSILDLQWQRFPAECFPSTDIRTTAVRGIQSSEPQASKEAYRPPGARGRPASSKLNEEKNPQSILLPNVSDQKLSKTALKNKKKRGGKNKEKQDAFNMDSRSEEQRAALATAAFVLAEPAPAPQVGVNVETEKKIKALGKKLKAIEKLKEQEASGKELEKNQRDKLNMEEELRRELANLELH